MQRIGCYHDTPEKLSPDPQYLLIRLSYTLWLGRRRVAKSVLTAFGVAMVLCVCGCGGRGYPPHRASSEDVALTTSDGLTIAATVYRAGRSAPAGLVLVHMLGTDRESWAPFASQAQQAGYMCIALDLRGHGDSKRQETGRLSYKKFTREDWYAALNDIAAAKHMLLSEGADPDNLAVVGASIGANLALNYAVADGDIQAVVLVSAGLDYQGIATEAAMQVYGRERPALLIVARDDAYAAESCRALQAASPGFCELREYPGAAHGTNLLDASDGAVDQVLHWLDAVIGAGAGTGGQATSGTRGPGDSRGRKREALAGGLRDSA
ncbi:MAG TPA: alpha/beta fold hydrolase [Candidatus Hydrogenedentes bacterium]|nr:alpha/beta fold hydrolase [Candidatus Hydrogenedentota bacterium]HIJ72464.1 alpha/beta fold hydrolase [Candidatus Hydrogenedentota bacterium]